METNLPLSSLAISFVRKDVIFELFDSEGGKIGITLECESNGIQYWFKKFKDAKKTDITTPGQNAWDAFFQDFLHLVNTQSYKDKILSFLSSKGFIKKLFDYFVEFFKKVEELQNSNSKRKPKKKELIAYEMVQKRFTLCNDLISSLLKEPLLMNMFMEIQYPQTVIVLVGSMMAFLISANKSVPTFLISDDIRCIKDTKWGRHFLRTSG